MLANNKSFSCPDVAIGDTHVKSLKKSSNQNYAPCRMGAARILEIGDAGVTAKFRSQTFEAARLWVRGQVAGKDAAYEQSDPLHARGRIVVRPRGNLARNGIWGP